MKLEELFKTKEGLEFKKYYDEHTLFDIIKTFRLEDAHTDFLSSFLDCKKNVFSLSKRPLISFIKLLGKWDLTEDSFEEEDVNVSVRTTLNNMHPDLIITIKDEYFILLEAKLEIEETSDDQCRKYYEYARDKYDFPLDKMAFVYLSLLDETISDEEHFIKITYQDLIDDLYSEYYDESKLLRDYLKSFMNLVKNNSLYDNLNVPIIKIDIDLTRSIVDKYEKDIERLIDTFKMKDLKEIDENISLFKILLIVIYKANLINDLEVSKKIKRLFRQDSFIMIIDNKKITTYGKIVSKLIEVLLNNGNSILDINSLISYDKGCRIIYTEEEFIHQNFNNRITSWYSDYKINNKSYKLLTTYTYDEINRLFEALTYSDLDLTSIKIVTDTKEIIMDY